MKNLLKTWFVWKNNIALIPLEKVTRDSETLIWTQEESLFSANLFENNIQGFYMLELTVKNASSNMNSAFFINGSLPKPSFMRLPIKSNGTFKRICHFPDKVESLTWQPSRDPGSLESVELILKKVTKGFAKSRMLKKLKKKEFEGNLHDLMLEYESYFEGVSYIDNPIKEPVSECGKFMFYLAADGSSGLTKCEELLSCKDKTWIEENKAKSFVRHSNGKIERLD